MRSVSTIFAQRELHLLCFIAFFLVLNWPVLSVCPLNDVVGMFHYLLVWVILAIAALFMIGRSLARASAPIDRPRRARESAR